MSSEVLPTLSNICGWAYVLAWGLFAYPQIYLNYKLKNVEGFKIDYPFLNVSGFVFYSIAYSIGYFKGPLPYDNYGLSTVELQDVVFSYHNLFTSTVLNIQYLMYESGNNKLTLFAKIYTVYAWLSAVFFYLATEVFDFIPVSADFNILIYLGYLKVFISFTKYIPLVYWYYKRRSTRGLSVLAFIFDLTGAITSVAQMFIDYADGNAPTLSPLKLSLGFVVGAYDIILLFQHFVFFGDKEPVGSATTPALNKVSDVESNGKVEAPLGIDESTINDHSQRLLRD